MSFICKDKCITDNNTHNKEDGIGQYEIECAKGRLIERSKYYESDQNSRFDLV